MFARLTFTRKVIARTISLLSVMWLAACDPISVVSNTVSGGQRVDPTAPVTVALLVPGGSGAETETFLAANLENAARMAVTDLQNVTIDLRVYNTGGGNPQQAALVATQAVNDGAKIIVGPLFAEAAIAAGNAVAGRNVNVLAFSNNTTIAGGNVFILGPTFDNTANRLVQYANRQGQARYAVVHSETLAGELGRDAIANAVRNNGGELAAVRGYAPSQQGIAGSVNGIVDAVKQSGATATFLTGTPAGAGADLPFILPALSAAGLNPDNQQFIGLTRWSANPQMVSITGAQGGIFALPDTNRSSLFETRYAAIYGETPHPLAGLAYDGIAAIGALLSAGNANALTANALTTPQGFQGTTGIFRLRRDGLNERGLAVAKIEGNQVVVLEAAPRSFGGAGF